MFLILSPLLYFLIPAIVIIAFLIMIIRTLLFKNKETKIINFESNDNGYGDKLLELVKIKTTSFHDEIGYHEFRERLKLYYPLIHQHFSKEKIGDNAVFTYKKKVENAPNILLATHIDSKAPYCEAQNINNTLFGTGTFDAKSLLFVIFEAVEELLESEGCLHCNLTIVMTTDDETTKEGSSLIVQQFLRRGKFFDLVLEEGSGIINPEHIGLKSHYAFIGMGVTGEAVIRFKGKHKKDLERFVSEVRNKNYKTKIDKYSKTMIMNIFKDTDFHHRFFFANMFFFKSKVKKIIEKEYPNIARLLKTTVLANDIITNADNYHLDLRFFLSTYDTTADALLAIDDLMDKYCINYEILDIKEASLFTSKKAKGYKIVKEVINTVFKNLYITPVVLTKLNEKRYFDKVSDCVLRFSPLYYPEEVLNFEAEYIPVNSITYGIEFFLELLRSYQTRYN